MSKFDFVASKPNIYKLCCDYEKYKGVDDEVALMKSRKVIEGILIEIKARKNCSLMEDIDKLSCPEDIRADFNLIRTSGNDAVHYTDEILFDIDKITIALFNICKWFMSYNYKKTLDGTLTALQKSCDKQDYALSARQVSNIAALLEKLQYYSNLQYDDDESIDVMDNEQLSNVEEKADEENSLVDCCL